MPAQALPLLVLGGTGRLGGALRDFWPFALKGGLRPIWQARDHRDMYLHWNILNEPAPPWAYGVVLCLAGGRGDPDPNTALALRTLEAAAAQGARHVFVASSSAVYGPGRALTEEAAPAPVSAYGRSKAAMEQAVLDWQARHGGPGVTLLRIGNVAGADALLGADRKGPVVLDPTPDGSGPRRSYIGPVTLSAVLSRLATQAVEGTALPQILNLATPLPVTMSALLDAAGLAWNFGPDNPDVVPEVTLDTARLQGLVRLPPTVGHPRNLAAEWRQWLGQP
jgi:nucleoside-diphosphate-sugar epimerase